LRASAKLSMRIRAITGACSFHLPRMRESLKLFPSIFFVEMRPSPLHLTHTIDRGDWLEDQQHGFGLQWRSSGQMYVGQWSDNKENGCGVFINTLKRPSLYNPHSGLTIFVGTFKNGCPLSGLLIECADHKDLTPEDFKANFGVLEEEARVTGEAGEKAGWEEGKIDFWKKMMSKRIRNYQVEYDGSCAFWQSPLPLKQIGLFNLRTKLCEHVAIKWNGKLTNKKSLESLWFTWTPNPETDSKKGEKSLCFTCTPKTETDSKKGAKKEKKSLCFTCTPTLCFTCTPKPKTDSKKGAEKEKKLPSPPAGADSDDKEEEDATVLEPQKPAEPAKLKTFESFLFLGVCVRNEQGLFPCPLIGTQKMLPATEPDKLGLLDGTDLPANLFEFEAMYDGRVWINDDPIPSRLESVKEYSIGTKNGENQARVLLCAT
jgi:hypothetical protein